MKRNTITIAAIAALAIGFGPAAKADDKGCTNATLKGTFVWTTTGFEVSPAGVGQGAEVGVETFDGKGGSTATAILSSNGNIIPVSIIGTYKVNPDCTGTSTLLVSPFGATIHLYFIISAGVNELQAIETEPGFIFTRIYHRQFPVGDIRN